MRPACGGVALLALLAVAGCGGSGGGDGGSRGADSLRAGPLGLAPGPVAAAYLEAARMPALESLLVARRGQLVVEGYWRGGAPRRDVNIKSASKSVISALVGIALHRGDLEGPGQPVAEFFPEYFDGDVDPRKREITLEHLLTMSSGLETTSFDNYGRWVSRRDWARGVLEQPVVAEPGRRMTYSTGSTHLLSVILTRATGVSTLEYARRHLFGPLGIETDGWQRSPQGYYFGGNNLRLSPRDLLAFGQLYLQRGTYGGRRVLPEAWVEASFTPRAIHPRFGREYGYLWWIGELRGRRVPYAWGYGGQFVFVVPDLELVVVATSASTPGERGGFGHLRRVFGLLEDHLIPAAEAQPRRATAAGD